MQRLSFKNGNTNVTLYAKTKKELDKKHNAFLEKNNILQDEPVMLNETVSEAAEPDTDNDLNGQED